MKITTKRMIRKQLHNAAADIFVSIIIFHCVGLMFKLGWHKVVMILLLAGVGRLLGLIMPHLYFKDVQREPLTELTKVPRGRTSVKFKGAK